MSRQNCVIEQRRKVRQALYVNINYALTTSFTRRRERQYPTLTNVDNTCCRLKGQSGLYSLHNQRLSQNRNVSNQREYCGSTWSNQLIKPRIGIKHCLQRNGVQKRNVLFLKKPQWNQLSQPRMGLKHCVQRNNLPKLSNQREYCGSTSSNQLINMEWKCGEMKNAGG